MFRLSTINERLSALDGWHRLFVALALLWAVPVMVLARIALSESQANYVLPSSLEARMAHESWRVTPQLREAATKIVRKPDGTNDGCERCSREEQEALVTFLRAPALYVRVSAFHPIALLSTLFWYVAAWFCPLAVVYGLARLFAWVVQGFRAG